MGTGTRRRLTNRLLIVWGLWITVSLTPLTLQAQAQPPLVFGVYPYLSPSQIASQFLPLRDHLASRLGRPVQLVSAAGFSEFIKQTAAGDHDIIFTAPHMGRLAEKRNGYVPVAQTGWQIEVLAVARKDGPVGSLSDLRNRSLAVGAKLSMTYQIVNQALAKHQLGFDRGVSFIDSASFSNVIDAVVRREADAGATGTILWDRAPADQREQLRIIFHSEPVPGFLVLAHPRVDKNTRQRLLQALTDFHRQPASKAYFEKTGHIDFRLVDEATMRRIDPFTRVFDEP